MKSIALRRRVGNGVSLVLYLIRAENGLIKIGVATDAADRLRTLDIGSPITLTLEYFVYTIWAKEIEYHLHSRYKAKRVKGEWYCLSESDIAEIKDTYGEIGTISSHTPDYL